MGNWFSNLHIRKSETLTKDVICACIKDILSGKNYTVAETPQEADTVAAVLDSRDSQWISVYSGIFAHDDPESCKGFAAPLSAQLHTDVLGIACFDSDYLYLNLINSGENTDGWIGIGPGKDVGISRRNSLTPWKKIVSDYPGFCAAVKGKYLCAEEFLGAAASHLNLPPAQSCASPEAIQEPAFQQEAVFLYFRQKEGPLRRAAELEIRNMRYAVPCFHGRENSISFLNTGEAFRGLSVYFLGPYVEQEEITFSDVKITPFGQPPVDLLPKKLQLPDGQWSYCCHAQELPVPPGVPWRMTPEKRYWLERERMLNLSFIPLGNPRKMLDITVAIVRDGSPDHCAKWNIWEEFGSKAAFIQHHNKIWKQVQAYETDPGQCLPLLKEEDFEA